MSKTGDFIRWRMPASQSSNFRKRTCPVCGKYAEAKFLDETTRRWTYKHEPLVVMPDGKRMRAPSVYHQGYE